MDIGSILYRDAYSIRHIGYGPHRIWTPPGSKFYVAGPYSIIEFWPAGSIFYREYRGIFHILYDTGKPGQYTVARAFLLKCLFLTRLLLRCVYIFLCSFLYFKHVTRSFFVVSVYVGEKSRLVVSRCVHAYETAHHNLAAGQLVIIKLIQPPVAHVR